MKQEKLNENISTENDNDSQKIYKLSRDERETHYYLSEIDNMVYVDTSIQKHIHKLEKQKWILVDTQYYRDGTVMAKKFKAPCNCLSPRSYNPNKPKRVISEEQRKATAERFAKIRESKKNDNQ